MTAALYPIRVLIIAPAPLGDGRIGGIANFIREFVHHMPADFAVEIAGAAVGTEMPARTWQKMTLAGRDVTFLPVARMGSARRTGRLPVKASIVAGMIRSSRKLAVSGRVIQVHSPAMDLGIVRRGARIVRVVHNDPDDLSTNKQESVWRHFRSGLDFAERISYRRASGVYFVNRLTRERYAAESSRPDKLHFLPNFVDTSVFRPLSTSQRDSLRAAIAEEHGLPEAAPWLLFAGRFDHQKDPLLTVRGFAATPHREGQPDPHLVMAGDGVLLQGATELAMKLDVAGRVHFLGTIPHHRLARMMPAMDAFLLSSDFEAGPTVVYEALAAGLPVVATRVGETPNLVVHGRTGWIEENRSAEDFSAGIRWAIAQDRLTISLRCSESMRPFHAATVLAPFYEAHRRLAVTASGI